MSSVKNILIISLTFVNLEKGFCVPTTLRELGQRDSEKSFKATFLRSFVLKNTCESLPLMAPIGGTLKGTLLTE